MLSLRLVVFLGPRIGKTKLTILPDSAAGSAGEGPRELARLSTDGMVWHRCLYVMRLRAFPQQVQGTPKCSLLRTVLSVFERLQYDRQHHGRRNFQELVCPPAV